MKYIAYVRRSSEDKKKQIQSIPNQLDWVKKTTNALGIEVLQTFQDMKTAKEPGREGFNAMMEFIYNSPEPLGILCWKMNRLSRNPVDEGAIKFALMKGKIKHIYAIDRQFKESENQILLGVEFGASTQYSIDLKSNVNFGMERKNKKGYRPCTAPTGYLNDPYAPKGEKKIYIDPERFDVLQGAWEKLLSGAYSIAEIWRELNANGFTTQKGNPIPMSTLCGMFKNTFYAGYYTWQGQVYQGKHTPMISAADFDRVQQILGRKNATRPCKNDQLLSGIITCGECGYGITSEDHTKTIKATDKQKTYTYLRCTKKNPLVVCSQKYLSLPMAEKQIQEQLMLLQLPPIFLDWFCELHRENRKQEVQKLGHKKGVLQKKITENKQMMQRLMDNLNRGVVDDDKYTENMNRYKETAIQFQEQYAKLEADNGDWIERLKEDFHFANGALERYQNGEKGTKRELLTRIGSNWMLKDKKLFVDLFPPFELFNKLRIFYDAEISRLELSLTRPRNSEKPQPLIDFSIWSSQWDEVRTFYSTNYTQ